MKTKALLVILFLGCLPMCFAINTKKFELQVIDKITKEPVPNIVVYYQVTKIKPVGVVDGKFTPVVQEKLITDGKGCIVIERKKLSLGFFEFLMELTGADGSPESVAQSFQELGKSGRNLANSFADNGETLEDKLDKIYNKLDEISWNQ